MGNEAKKKPGLNWYGPYEIIAKKFSNTYKLREIGKGGKSKEVERLISGDRLHRAKVYSEVQGGWHMPTGKGKKRLYGSTLWPQLPLEVPEDTIIVEEEDQEGPDIVKNTAEQELTSLD